MTFGDATITGHTADAPVRSHTTTVVLTSPLVPGDRLTLKASRVRDVSGNQNAAKSGTAENAQASPSIRSVLMSGLHHSAHNAWSLPCTGSTRAVLGVSSANRNVAATPTNEGRTQFAIEVNFNTYISAVSAEQHDELLEDLLAAAATRVQVANTDDGIRADADGEPGTAAGGGLSVAASEQTAVTGPTRRVRYEGETALAGLLPMAGDLVNTAAGATTLAASEGPPRIAARAEAPSVASGYAANDDTTTVKARTNQDLNAASQNRIAVSSSVKARN